MLGNTPSALIFLTSTSSRFSLIILNSEIKTSLITSWRETLVQTRPTRDPAEIITELLSCICYFNKLITNPHFSVIIV